MIKVILGNLHVCILGNNNVHQYSAVHFNHFVIWKFSVVPMERNSQLQIETFMYVYLEKTMYINILLYTLVILVVVMPYIYTYMHILLTQTQFDKIYQT